jgi:hypothetical protein
MSKINNIHDTFFPFTEFDLLSASGVYRLRHQFYPKGSTYFGHCLKAGVGIGP